MSQVVEGVGLRNCVRNVWDQAILNNKTLQTQLCKYRCCLPLYVKCYSRIHLYNPLTLGTQQSRHALISRGRLQSNGLPGKIVCGLAPAIDLAFVTAVSFGHALSLYFAKKIGRIFVAILLTMGPHTQTDTHRETDTHSPWWSTADVAIGHQTRSQINEVRQQKEKDAKKRSPTGKQTNGE